MNRILIVMALALTGAFAGNARATVISGTFGLTGTVTATKGAIDWSSSAAVPNQGTVGGGVSLTGSFVGLADTLVSIQDSNESMEPVGLVFPAQDFIKFLSPLASSFPGLMVNFVADGVGGASGCTSTPPAPGQICTPMGSPFTFTNFPASSSSAVFVLSGVTSDDMGTWTGIFTTQFNVPFQSILAGLASTGSFTASYSATISVISKTVSVPEPGALALLAAGLALMALLGRRTRKGVSH